jgi:hypothetical protein
MSSERFKFRAWHHGGGDPRIKGRMNYSYPFPVLFWEQVEDEVLSVELMQSTGLHDKNGKLIFESDFIKAAENWIGSVHWCEDSLQWRCKDHALTDLRELEIVGNLYEHPELKEVE